MKGVCYGLIPLSDALARWDISEEEFNGWKQSVERFGEVGLKATQVQNFR